ncbi:Uncharacterised protein [uncultured Ruminococcus sp.]|uniref:Uncharacterized protein n=1 Tax=Massiliimalia timonensis TaxID=1987501 RepID=A0A8J6P6D6_9FIRM|nr:hypothetical protein [Massiliimalia timonensis]MBC8610050.1 hypothetical protein [Massiliimalia timonensis]SCH12777.1 Uncharacterised protein [uncultured Ruminococcus sp.]SCH80306.1 Uncharacterised protein [uncultured Clostridium sp.]
MKIFEKALFRLIQQRESSQEPEIPMADPQQEHEKIKTIDGEYDTVAFGEGISLEEIEEKTEYRRRRSVRALD